MLKGNKGEWSEIYAFCYLLAREIISSVVLAELRLQKIQLLNYILTILSLGQRVEKQNSKIYRPCVQDVISEKVILSDKR